MSTRGVAAAAAAATALALAGCAGGGLGAREVVGGSASHAAVTRSAPPTGPDAAAGLDTGGPLPARGLPPGKYRASAIAFPSGQVGVATISGYPGDSLTPEAWIERTTDGGTRWASSRPAAGPDQPGAQSGLAFASAETGWAYGPGLLFTRDGGTTWRGERAPFPLTGPVAVAGTSTWVAGYPCVRGACPAAIYTAGRVGGPLTPLADQPPASGSVVAMWRPSASVAWLLFAGPKGRQRLETTIDAGRTWSARPLPCRPGGPGPDQLSVTGPTSLWLACEGKLVGMSFAPSVLYRTVDGARTWIRAGTEELLSIHAVSNRVAWAVEDDSSENLVVRTTNGGRTWHTVLRAANLAVQAFVPQGVDGALAIAEVFSADGERFVAYRTRDAGKTWQRAPLRPAA